MRIFGALALAGAVVAVPAIAQEKAAVKPGFSLPADKPVRILVFRPDVKVGSQSAGGVVTPNAQWTASARRLLADAITAARPGGASDVVFMPELEGEDAMLLADYQALFSAVADTVLQHRLFKGDRLPTKKTGFEYTLGPGVAKVAEKAGGDYALFVTTNDAFGSTGRKLLQLFAAGAVGVGVTSGEHIGYAGLIDLKTGDLVWINADYKMGGDVREADGAAKRARQLLEDFPAPGTALAVAGK
ncbi:MAG: hypothetical protein JSS55_05525 [Proteobacteria bacterium]|nr:hypothetical protein [Pseudomonadota bacterium]